MSVRVNGKRVYLCSVFDVSCIEGFEMAKGVHAGLAAARGTVSAEIWRCFQHQGTFKQTISV